LIASLNFISFKRKSYNLISILKEVMSNILLGQTPDFSLDKSQDD